MSLKQGGMGWKEVTSLCFLLLIPGPTGISHRLFPALSGRSRMTRRLQKRGPEVCLGQYHSTLLVMTHRME